MTKQQREERDEYIWRLSRLGFVASQIRQIISFPTEDGHKAIILTTKQIRRILERKQNEYGE